MSLRNVIPFLRPRGAISFLPPRNVIPFLRPAMEVSVSIPEPLFAALVAAVQEYREEAEGLGMPRTVAACDRLLAQAKAV